MRRMPRLSAGYGNVVGTLALFVALGGAAYAATLPKNSVKAKQIKANAVRAAETAPRSVGTSEVQDGSLLAGDFADGQLPEGPRGPEGEQGPEGAVGPQGPSGTVTTMTFDQTVWAPSVSANATMPAKCRTPGTEVSPSTYVAGENEVAIVQVAGTAAPPANVQDYLYVAVGVIKDGGAPSQITTKNAEGMNDGSASASAVARIPLAPGSTYRFGSMFSANSAGGVNLAGSTCQGTVTIVRGEG